MTAKIERASADMGVVRNPTCNAVNHRDSLGHLEEQRLIWYASMEATGPAYNVLLLVWDFLFAALTCFS
jgi:hypothetical protein